MAYKIELDGRRIILSVKAESKKGDYVVYEWNDGIFIDDDDYGYDDDDDEYETIEDELVVDDDEIEVLEEDEVEESVRLDIEALLNAGFYPQGGVNAHMTDEYTTIYSQAFFKKK